MHLYTIHYNDKVITEILGLKACSVYKCVLRIPMLDNNNRVRFIGVMPVNGKASDDRNSVSACGSLILPIARPQSAFKRWIGYYIFELFCKKSNLLKRL